MSSRRAEPNVEDLTDYLEQQLSITHTVRQTADAGSSAGRRNASHHTPGGRDGFHRILELRQKLHNIIHVLRTDSKRKLGTDRREKNGHFYELYETISELLSQGHYAGFEECYEGLIIASINPEDPLNARKDSWYVLIEDRIASYLDVKEQISTQFSNIETSITCYDFNCKSFTMRSANFKESRLILSKPEERCKDTKNVIYGIRCKLCLAPDEINSNISYVGKVGRGKAASVHKRHTKYQYEANANMNKHVNTVHEATLNFHDMMEMIYLPTGVWGIVNPIHLYSWECFWQFFCRVRECRGGWGIRAPNKDVVIVKKGYNC